MKTKYLLMALLGLFIILGALLFFQQKNISTSMPKSSQKDVLVDFFYALSKKDYEKADSLFNFSDENVEFLSTFVDPVQDVPLLENYCNVMGTCLPIGSIQDGDPAFNNSSPNKKYYVVTFINNDGSDFVLGPCCGASESEMPSKTEFTYEVVKVGNEYKVNTLPLYRP